MKRYILMIMCCLATMMTYAQHVNCTSISDTAVTISRWGEFYTPVPGELECWTVDLDVEGAVKISYNISLDCFDAIDHVTIYELDDNNQAKSIGGFCATIESGVWVSTSHRFKVEYWGLTGNLTNDYEGFQLHFEEASQEHVVNHDYYVLGKLGVGTIHPKEMLHVNGAIRGDGANGEVTLKGENGSVTIGATDAQTMTFNTDKSKYAFNSNGINRIAIHSNGNVGIGTQLPQQKLDVAGAIRANGLIVNGNIRAHEIVVTTTGADFVFAEEYRLRPLSEVKAFITENKHLPEIKSAQEMQEDGVGINELQVQLLQKIEELTLYILQQEERIAVLEMELKK